MKFTIGEKIRELRLAHGWRQDDLARALGVTAQAVSRWEAGGCYPDLELIPAIANCFDVSTDELFGYGNDRAEKIEAILRKVDAFHIRGRSDDGWVDECLAILRDGVAEFPQNERLRFALADTLAEAGWRRYHERTYYDEDGYLCRACDEHRRNPYWDEAIRLCETLAASAHDCEIGSGAAAILALLYRNIGEPEKAIAWANRMPPLRQSREVLSAHAADGKAAAQKIGALLLRLADTLSEQVVYALLADKNRFPADLAAQKVRGVLALWSLLCDDGNFGAYHGTLIKLHLYLSRLEWEAGRCDAAFDALDEALRHARALERCCDGQEHAYTAPLVSHVTYPTDVCDGIAQTLPDDWPFWHSPCDAQTAWEIQADPRWASWVARCRADTAAE